MVAQCYFCGGNTEHRKVTAENWWGDALALVEDVPAWVCEDCGEAYFDAETCKRLDLLRVNPPSAARTVQVPVYTWSDETR